MKKVMISPSMMCADILKLKETISEFEKNNIDYLHIDIMDGHFVPNFTLGTDYCNTLKKITDIPLDIHLMINEPENKLDWFTFGKNDIVSVHCESTKHLQKSLAYIDSQGAVPFVALNPATPVYTIEEVTDYIGGVLVMTVNPGFAGQKMVESTLKKIPKVRNLIGKDKLIETDGNVSFENGAKMIKEGADILVAGTSSIFNKNFTLTQGIEKLRKVGE